jgi:hypothetical protein
MKYIDRKEWDKLVTGIMSYQFKDYTKNTSRKHLHGCHCVEKPSTGYLTFDMKSRKRYLRNILCELKSEICGDQDLFDVGFDIENVDGGFECEFVISPKKDVDIECNSTIDSHYKIRDFVVDTLDYLVSKDVEIDWSTNRNSLTTRFTLFSF